MAKTEFEQFIADEIEKGKGRYIPVKAGPMERLFVKKPHARSFRRRFRAGTGSLCMWTTRVLSVLRENSTDLKPIS